MTKLKSNLGDIVVKNGKAVPAFSYVEISDHPLIKANMYYLYVCPTLFSKKTAPHFSNYFCPQLQRHGQEAV